jgi:hypothetical protein
MQERVYSKKKFDKLKARCMRAVESLSDNFYERIQFQFSFCSTKSNLFYFIIAAFESGKLQLFWTYQSQKFLIIQKCVFNIYTQKRNYMHFKIQFNFIFIFSMSRSCGSEKSRAEWMMVKQKITRIILE